MNLISKLLLKSSEYCETYRGHDNLLSLIGYMSRMLSGTKYFSELYSNKLIIISNEISNARVILRFLDDFSMLGYTLSYGLGKHVIYFYFYF